MGVDAFVGDRKDDAFIAAADGATPREKFRNGIIRLRRDLWRVESGLKALESRSVTSFDPGKLRPEFSAMFNDLVKLIGDFYGLTLTMFDDDMTLKVIQDFSRRFDFARKMGGNKSLT
jgi:hypothetical protein